MKENKAGEIIVNKIFCINEIKSRKSNSIIYYMKRMLIGFVNIEKHEGVLNRSRAKQR